MVKIYFSNCDPITAYGEDCDRQKEGQICQKKKLSGKIDQFQGFYNQIDKKARGFKIRMEDGRMYGLGYTPSKFLRE